jgi:hypothetical protein
VNNAFGVVGASSLLIIPSEEAHAARGAFELDSEYYIRDLLGGNKKEGNVMPSNPPEMPPPRVLQGPLLPLLLDNSFSPSCTSVQALVRQITKISGGDSTQVAKLIAESATEYRTKASRSFSAKAPWKQEDVSDQYYFDLSAYALWKTAADLLPSYRDRDIFARNVGRLLYQVALSASLLKQGPDKKRSIMASEPAVFEILQLFQSTNFCKGYRVGTDPSPPSASAQKKQEDNVFDQLDDEAITNGASVDCLVSVYEPATLGASLQITGEQSRFAPDFVGATLAALWESIGIKSSWEIFFVDPEYRPNPKDYYPNEKLLQFTLSEQ